MNTNDFYELKKSYDTSQMPEKEVIKMKEKMNQAKAEKKKKQTKKTHYHKNLGWRCRSDRSVCHPAKYFTECRLCDGTDPTAWKFDRGRHIPRLPVQQRQKQRRCQCSTTGTGNCRFH